MALFNKKEEEKEVEAEKEKKADMKKADKAKKKIFFAKNSDIAYGTLLEPWVTEKSYAGVSENKYTFKVSKGSAKGEIKKAVEGMFGVEVEKITVTNSHSKKKNFGRHAGVKAGFRKAVVKLKKGNSIELFEGAK